MRSLDPLWPVQALRRTIAPDVLVTVAEAKVQCHVDGSHEDEYILALAAAAQAAIEGPSGMTGRALLPQTWTLEQGRMSGKARLSIPVAPFRSVTSLKYYDAANVQQTAGMADFVVFANDDAGYIEPRTAWPVMYDRPDALELVFVAGYGSRAEVPQTVVQACLLLIGHWYRHREMVTAGAAPAEVPFTVKDLINMERAGWVRS
jgi:uncharacterized phiE125 gp8 family phage protein